MKSAVVGNVRVEQIRDDQVWLYFTAAPPFYNPRRDIPWSDDVYSIRLALATGEPEKYLIRKARSYRRERFQRTLTAAAKANAPFVAGAMATVHARDLFNKARAKYDRKASAEAARIKRVHARKRIERNGPRLALALEAALVAMGRAGANGNVKHPQRKAWEGARAALRRAGIKGV